MHDKNEVPAGTRITAVQINSVFDEITASMDRLPSEAELNEGRGQYGVDVEPIPQVGNTRYTVSISNVVTLTDGLIIYFESSATSAGTSTLNVNGLGAKEIINPSGAAMVAGSLPVGSKHCVQYDQGTDSFILISATNVGLSGPCIAVYDDGDLVTACAESITFAGDYVETTIEGVVIEVDIAVTPTKQTYVYATPPGAAAHLDRTSGSLGTASVGAPHADSYVAGDFDVQAQLTKADWAESDTNLIWQRGTYLDSRVGIDFNIVAGKLRAGISSNGIGDAVSVLSSVAVPFSANDKGWVRVTRKRSTEKVNFYTSDDDRATWDQLGTADLTLSISGNPIFNHSTMTARVGQQANGANTITAKVHRAICLDGIDADPDTILTRRASDFDPKGQAGETSWTGVTDEDWTVSLTTIEAD